MTPLSSASRLDTGSFTRALADAGLDLVRAFDAARYNAAIAGHSNLRPLDLGGRASALGLVVGNTRALWPRFRAAFAARPELQASGHPLDAYVRSTVMDASSRLGAACRVRFADEEGEARVSMLHAAAASRLAHVGPAHLAVHAEHGPWLGLRAVVVVDATPLPDAPSASPSPCAGCAAPCVGALERALATTGALPRGQEEIASAWRAWVAVRDACPVGTASRYGEAQLRYHYTKDRRSLTGDVEGD